MQQNELYVHGPDPESGQRRSQVALARWQVADEVDLLLTGPFGEFGASAPDLFRALYFLRTKLAEQQWLVLCAGARRDAWHSTDKYPCAPHQARLYPTPGGEPETEPVDVFEPCLDEATVDLVTTPPQQWLYHRRGITSGTS